MSTRTQTLKRVSHYWQSILPKYQASILQQKQLQSVIQSCLPDNLSAHVFYCVASGTRILLFTDSASWATQLRFFQQQIIDSVKTKGNPQLNCLQIKVISLTLENRVSTRQKRIPCQKNIDIIRQHASQQTDPKLNHSLFKLSEALRKRSKPDSSTGSPNI